MGLVGPKTIEAAQRLCPRPRNVPAVEIESRPCWSASEGDAGHSNPLAPRVGLR